VPPVYGVTARSRELKDTICVTVYVTADSVGAAVGTALGALVIELFVGMGVGALVGVAVGDRVALHVCPVWFHVQPAVQTYPTSQAHV